MVNGQSLKKITAFVILTIFFTATLSAHNLPINIEYAFCVLPDDDKVPGYYGAKNRMELLSTSHVSKHVLDCLIATEDREFYNHGGISVKRLIKAAWNTLTGSTQGGSTITMQLARNLFLTNEQTIERKIKEIYLARELEKKYSKDQLLLLYLNTVYFGRGAYGIWAASQEYYKKTPDKLTLIESAMVVGLLKAPSGYEPFTYPDKALKRRNVVLYNLFAVGKLSEEEYNKLKNAPLGLLLKSKQKQQNFQNASNVQKHKDRIIKAKERQQNIQKVNKVQENKKQMVKAKKIQQKAKEIIEQLKGRITKAK